METNPKDHPSVSAELDPARQEKARLYARIQRRFMLLDLLLGAALLLAWLLAGWSVDLRNWITSWTGNPWIAVAAFGGIFGGIFTVLDLPLSFYTGYILPHRFEQSNLTLQGWLSDLVKGLLLSALLGGLILEIIYWLLRSAPDSWWLWVGGFLLLFNVLLANLAPVLLFPIFYKFSALDESDQELEERLLATVNGYSPQVAVEFGLPAFVQVNQQVHPAPPGRLVGMHGKVCVNIEVPATLRLVQPTALKVRIGTKSFNAG
ncbi:MAG: hypothetical protein P8Y37_06575 [Anaerolineales bacterium]